MSISGVCLHHGIALDVGEVARCVFLDEIVVNVEIFIGVNRAGDGSPTGMPQAKKSKERIARMQTARNETLNAEG